MRCVALIVLVTLFATACGTTFTVDLTNPSVPLRHVWEQCVGSGHAALAMRQDWRAQLAQQQSEVGWRHVRFHGILDDDLSTYLNGQGNYFNLDSIFDFLLSINMRPIVELSFMPDELKSSDLTVFHYKGNISPPKDYALWDAFMTDLGNHLIARYGLEEISKWRFEVWNEPNCGFFDIPACCGVTGCGNQTAYFELYSHTCFALKAANPAIQVGGPATAQCSWITDFLTFTKTNNVPVDFVSTHLYPTDPTVQNVRTGFEDMLAARAQTCQAYGVPLVITEYNSGLGIDEADYPYSAAFVVHQALAMQSIPNIDTLSYWTFSDVFEEQGFDSTPFNQKFGMVTIENIAKPVYRAFQELHRLGNTSVLATTQGTVDIIASITSDHKGKNIAQVVLTNYNRFGLPCTAQAVNITFSNFPGQLPTHANLVIIDSTHSNPRPLWEAMGSPMYLNKTQISVLDRAAKMNTTAVPLVTSGATASLTISMEANSVASFDISLQ